MKAKCKLCGKLVSERYAHMVDSHAGVDWSWRSSDLPLYFQDVVPLLDELGKRRTA